MIRDLAAARQEAFGWETQAVVAFSVRDPTTGSR